MVRLWCAIVRRKGGAFSVQVNESDTVETLKAVILKRKKKKLRCDDSDDLQLFRAKAAGGSWLKSDDPAVIAMRSGDTPVEVKTLLDLEMDPTAEIGDLFKGAPTKTTIHVLVVGPNGIDIDGGQDVERDSLRVPATEPKGPDVNVFSPDDLLAFLESEMTNKVAIISSPHILEADSLQFRLVGRAEAIATAARCFSNIVAVRGTTASDRTRQVMPVCSGISGLGKTRILEESGRIFEEMKMDPKRVDRLIVPYYNGFSVHPVEKSMPIEASFSWRLLYRFFLDKNCAVKFDMWFTSRLPRNGNLLTLSGAMEVIERKLRQRVPCHDALYLFLGIDEYQKIEDVDASRKQPNTSLLRELVETIGAFLCSKSANLVVLPMFAGTDLGVIASGSIANSSYYVTEQLPMTLLTLDEVLTFVKSNPAFAGFLRSTQIRRNLFTLGGVPRWVVDYLLELKKCSQPDVVTLDNISSCYHIVWSRHVVSYLTSMKIPVLVRLAAAAVSGQAFDPKDTIDEHWKLSRLRDSSLCLLTPRKMSTSGACDVQVPYALLANIGGLKTLESQEERDFAKALDDMKNMVDLTMFDLQPWQSWEMFGACFYAVRINALLVLGYSTVTLEHLFPGARMSSETRNISVKLVSSRVIRCAERFGSLTTPLISRQGNQSEQIDWTSGGYIVVNGDNGAGVDIFFALKDAATDEVVVFVDQRKRQFGKFQPSHAKEYLGKLSVCPAFLKESARLVRGVMNCVSASNLAAYTVPDDCFLLSRDETELFHGTLAYHPACTPIISINSACKTALKTLFRGDRKHIDEVVEEIMRKREEPSGGYSNSEELGSFCEAKRLKLQFDGEYGEFTS